MNFYFFFFVQFAALVPWFNIFRNNFVVYQPNKFRY